MQVTMKVLAIIMITSYSSEVSDALEHENYGEHAMNCLMDDCVMEYLACAGVDPSNPTTCGTTFEAYV